MHTPEYVSIYSLFRLFLHAGLLAAGGLRGASYSALQRIYAVHGAVYHGALRTYPPSRMIAFATVDILPSD